MTFDGATLPQLMAVIYCRSNGLEPLAEMFASSLDDVKAKLITARDTDHIHRLQGKAETLQDFLQLLETAPDTVGRMKQGARFK